MLDVELSVAELVEAFRHCDSENFRKRSNHTVRLGLDTSIYLVLIVSIGLARKFILETKFSKNLNLCLIYIRRKEYKKKN